MRPLSAISPCPTSEELTRSLLDLLSKCDKGLVDYLAVKESLGSVVDRVSGNLFSSTLLSLPHDSKGMYSVFLIAQFIVDECSVRHLLSRFLKKRTSAAVGPGSGSGAGTEAQLPASFTGMKVSMESLEDILFELSRTLFQVSLLTEQFLPLWVFTAAHTIRFFSGVHRLAPGELIDVGRAFFKHPELLSDLCSMGGRSSLGIASAFFDSKSSLQQGEGLFSRMRAVRHYDSFTVFEPPTLNRQNESMMVQNKSVMQSDEKSMSTSGSVPLQNDSLLGDNSLVSPPPPLLTVDPVGKSIIEKCCVYNGGYISPIFSERLTLETSTGSVDYRSFLDFAIAFDNRKSVEGVSYLWRYFDSPFTGYLTRETIALFIDELVKVLDASNRVADSFVKESYSSDILLTEFIDLINSGIDSDDGGIDEMRGEGKNKLRGRGSNQAASLDPSDPDVVVTYEQATANLRAARAVGTIFGCLISTTAFYEHEAREESSNKEFASKQLRLMQMAATQADPGTHEAIIKDLINSRFLPSRGSPGKEASGSATLKDHLGVSSSLPSSGFAAFLDYHEQAYGGESMEPWLSKYYAWESARMDGSDLLWNEFSVSTTAGGSATSASEVEIYRSNLISESTMGSGSNMISDSNLGSGAGSSHQLVDGPAACGQNPADLPGFTLPASVVAFEVRE